MERRIVGELHGPFSTGEDVIQKIKIELGLSEYLVIHLGINAPEKTAVIINNENIEIGKTEIYEINDIAVNSCSFAETTSDKVFVNFVVKVSSQN